MLFWIDPHKNINKTDEQFLNDLKNVQLSDCLINEVDPYQGYLKFVKLITYSRPIYFSDPNSPVIYEKLPSFELEKANKIEDFSDYQELIDYILKNCLNTPIFLTTSGTTGRPKVVEHSLKSLSRNVRLKDSLKNKVWSLAFHPYHMAGLQVFLQAFLTKCSIVYFDKDAITKFSEYVKLTNVTHLAFTPTYFKQVQNQFSDTQEKVEVVSFGGEKVSNQIIAQAKRIFSKANVRSIYASTEAGSLFTSNDGVFTIPSVIAEKVKIGEDAELLIHGSLIGNNLNSIDWYHTGDMVKMVENNKFIIEGRKSDFINVGGYKVNPHLVESLIESIPIVKRAVVKGRTNSVTGSIVVVEVCLKSDHDQKDELRKEILKICHDKLQLWEVPRLIKFVEELSETTSGKVLR